MRETETPPTDFGGGVSSVTTIDYPPDMPEIGDVVPDLRGTHMVLAPSHCLAGHRLGPYRVLVGNYPCQCGSRHMTWACLEPGCDGEVAAPPRGENCSAAY